MGRKTLVSQDTNEKNLVFFSEILKGIEHFVFFGTLLGLVRDNHLIEWDDDVDFYVNSRDRNALLDIFQEEDVAFDLNRFPNNTPHLLQVERFVGEEKGLIDFYFYDSEIDGDHICEEWNFKGPVLNASNSIRFDTLMTKKTDIFPIKHVTFSGVEVNIPANVLEVCSFLYGESWRTPIRKDDAYTVRTVAGRPELILLDNSTPTPSVHSQTDQKELPIRVVCATKCSASDFLTSTLTGRSLRAFSNDNPIDHIQIEIADNNSRGLSSVYNQAIEAATSDPAILVFIHDDIMITDFFWTERVRSGLENFDVVGLAGCQDRKPYQPNWFFSKYISGQLIRGDLQRSGAVAHGEEPFAPISNFGPTLVECKLMDGLFLAVNSETLVRANVQFDDDFKFHFYDMDFCRSVEKANLKMGTIPLSVVHKSGGNFATVSWSAAYQKYIEKWND